MFNFINPGIFWLGLAGISLPIIAHLLSKRKYDVVNWGAMQFLELRQNARRKILLEQLLLLALRIGLIALLALAFMRPWAEGSWFSKAVGSQNRDVVIIVDGSYSMGWEGSSLTPHQSAVQLARHVLEDLGSGAAVALIDARDKPRVLIEVPTRDFGLVREQLDALPPPSGSADLPAALRKAVQILSRTSNLSREIVVITDRQAKSWRADDEPLWATYDDQLSQPAIRPRTWVLEVGEKNAAQRANFSVSRLQLSREVAAVGYPVRVQAKIRYSGSGQSVVRKAFFEVDGQRLDEKTQTKNLSAGGEATVEFEYAFKKAGSHRLSVVLEGDPLPGDNRAEAVVLVTQPVPVLLVDGDPHEEDPIQSETVFAFSALSPRDNPAPWVRVRKEDVVSWRRLDGKLKSLDRYSAIVLANVPQLSGQQISALSKYVANGGGLFFALGNRVDQPHYNDRLFSSGNGLLPASLGTIEENKDETKQTVQVANKSLEVSWLQRFKLEADSDLCEARFSHRWTTQPAAPQPSPPAAGGKKKSAGKTPNAPSTGKSAQVSLGEALVAARLTTGDPFLITRNYGRGRVVLMTTALDADWSTLPAKDDYTPLLHEIIFFLTSGKSNRNVEVGMPLVLEVPQDTRLDQFAFFGPGGVTLDPVSGGVLEKARIVRLDDTALPGLYAFGRKGADGKPDPTAAAEYFVVNYDRGESNLTPLSDPQREALTKSSDKEAADRMTFVADRAELTAAMFQDNSRSEFWWIMLLIFLGILVFEVVMTRRMVQGGHAVDESGDETAATPGPPPLQRRTTPRTGSLPAEEDYWQEAPYEPARAPQP